MQQKQVRKNELVPMMAVIQAQMNQPMVRDYPTDLALRQQCFEIEQMSEANDLPVKYGFSMPIPSGHQVYEGDQYDWVVLEASTHPQLKEEKLPVPERVWKDLKRINKVMDFHQIWIAEEVEKGSVSPYAPLRREPFVPPPSRRVVEESRRLGSWSESIGRLMASPWTWAAGASLLASMALPVVVGLDPVLFGVNTASGQARVGEVGAFFYLGHWAWNDE